MKNFIGKWYLSGGTLKKLGIDLEELEELAMNSEEGLRIARSNVDHLNRYLMSHLKIDEKRFFLRLPDKNKERGHKVVRQGLVMQDIDEDGNPFLKYLAEDGEEGRFEQVGKTLVDSKSPFRFRRKPEKFLERLKLKEKESRLPEIIDEDEFQLLLDTFYPVQDSMEELDIMLEEDVAEQLRSENIPVPEDLEEIVEDVLTEAAEVFARDTGLRHLKALSDEVLLQMLEFAESDAAAAYREGRYLMHGRMRLNSEIFYIQALDQILARIIVKLQIP